MAVVSRGAGTTRVLIAAVVIAVLAGGTLFLLSLPPSKESNPTSATSTANQSGQSTTAAYHGTLMFVLQPGVPYVASDIQGNFTLVLLPGGNLASTLQLNATSGPGLTVRFKPTQVSTGGGEIVTQVFIAVSKDLQPGQHSFTASVTGGGQTFMQTFQVQVIPFVVYTVGDAYFPGNLTVPKGSTVTWVRLNGAIDQYDPGEHDIDFTAGFAHSPTLSQYDSWSYTFNQSGTFNYYCTFHPFMKGSIVVGP